VKNRDQRSENREQRAGNREQKDALCAEAAFRISALKKNEILRDILPKT
jgi:hypothetical protein